MLATSHKIVRQVVRTLAAGRVKHFVVCPGSRNSPLLAEIARTGAFTTIFVVDERVAAFIALGIAKQTGAPVGLTCTSGSAPLNFAPALAEAFYAGVPLVAVTADRPAHRIDVLDSQTIRQPGIYRNFIKYECDLADDNPRAADTVAEAIEAAINPFPGPVHINVRITDPVGVMTDIDNEVFAALSPLPPVATRRDNSSFDFSELAAKRILIAAGPLAPNTELQQALAAVAKRPNVVVVQDAPACTGLGSEEAVTAPDLFFAVPHTQSPDVVLTLGGSAVSGTMKKYLRKLPDFVHISLGQPGKPDTYGRLKAMVSSPEAFLNRLATQPAPDSTFRQEWLDTWHALRLYAAEKIANGPFTALQALSSIIPCLSKGSVLHLSNGMTVRYAQYANLCCLARVDCNRGVSGIDGSTSTALGAALTTPEPVVLLSGDMSAQYDLAALAAINPLPPNFRMAVFSNGGGNIFRHIADTRTSPVLETCLAGPVNFPAEALARAFNIYYSRAETLSQLCEAASRWIEAPGAAILEIVTDGHFDAQNYINFIKDAKKNLDSH